MTKPNALAASAPADDDGGIDRLRCAGCGAEAVFVRGQPGRDRWIKEHAGEPERGDKHMSEKV